MTPRQTFKTIEKVEGVRTPPEFVVLRHPALGTGVESMLFRVPAYSESETVKGYEGYLTRGTAPNEQIVDPGTCLRPGNCYFQVGSRGATEPENYALLRGIQQWKLEDKIIPRAWKDAASWDGRERGHRGNTCILSGANEKVQLAHLIPAALHDWLVAQEILQYAPNNRVTRGLETRNSSNTVRLFGPLHGMLDDGSWTFFPFPDAESPEMWRFYGLWLRRNDVMANWYHFRPVRGGCDDVTAQAMFARFACNFFLCMQTDHFALRRDWYLQDDDGTARMTSPEELDEWLRKNQTSTDPKRRSKSASPTKRLWSEVQGDEAVDVMDDEAWRHGQTSGSLVDSAIFTWDETDEDEPGNEEKRWRSSSGAKETRAQAAVENTVRPSIETDHDNRVRKRAIR